MHCTRVILGLLWAIQAPRSAREAVDRGLYLGADSAHIVGAAHAAQSDFERRRRANLPFATGPAADRCDARVGRLCYWHDEGVQPRRVDEPLRIVRAREQLIATLDSAAQLLPADHWIAGQRVRYLVEAGDVARAISAGRDCRGGTWWCRALEAFALHEATRFAEADSVYALAIAAMPEEVRCTWTDLTSLLDGPAHDVYARASCRDRQALNDRVWWLAQPLYSLHANDLRTEHYARVTMALMWQDAASPQGLGWGDDLRELIIRYGWPRWFTRTPAPAGGQGPPLIVGHDPQPSFAFVPATLALDSVLSAAESDWQLTSRASQTSYAPAYATAVREAPHQIARFARGDSMLVVATYDVAGDSLLAKGDLKAALVLAPDESTRLFGERSPAPASGSIAVMGPGRPLLTSLELLGSGGLMRSRRSLAPLDARGRITLSDVLLFDPRGEAPRSLNDAMATALATPRALPGRRLGLYWEVYGVQNGGEPIEVTLAIQRTDSGWWLSARRFLHLAGSDAPIELRWNDVAEPVDGHAGRAVAVDLSRLAAGRYQVRIEVVSAAGPRATTQRDMDVLQ